MTDSGSQKQEGTPNPFLPELTRLIRYPEAKNLTPLRIDSSSVADDIGHINPVSRVSVGKFVIHKTKCDPFENRFSSKRKSRIGSTGLYLCGRRGEVCFMCNKNSASNVEIENDKCNKTR